MESAAQHRPSSSQQSASKSSNTSPVLLTTEEHSPPPPPSSSRSSPRSQQQHDHDDSTVVQQELLVAEPSGKTSELHARRLSFMSFMSFMSGKSAKSARSSKSYAEHEHHQDSNQPRSAERTSATRRSLASQHGSTRSEAPRLPALGGARPFSSSSPRRSPLEDRASFVGSEEDNVGALPAFGISERGYLASLVSLFSTGPHGGNGSGVGGGGDHDGTTCSSSHSPLSSAQTALTVPSIEDKDKDKDSHLGRYEYDVQHSSAVYAFPTNNKDSARRLGGGGGSSSSTTGGRSLYVGLPALIHPPPEALLEFELETLPLLERDLHEVSVHFGQRGVRLTLELRMSGLASDHNTVTLAPTVWILYRSYGGSSSSPSPSTTTTTDDGGGELLQTCHRQLQLAVAKLPYLQQRGVEIQEGGGRIELAGDRRLVNVPVHADDQIHLSGGGALSVHIEDCQNHDQSSSSSSSSPHSVCGALCSITIEEDDHRQTQGLCRIGGLLLVNGKYILGVTTAHAMLDSSTIFKDSFDSPAEPRSRPSLLDASDPPHDHDHDHHRRRLAAAAAAAADREAIRAEARHVAQWADVTRDAAVDFLGVSMNSRGEMAINRAKPEHATDFALLRLRGQMPGDQGKGGVWNQYTPPNAERPVQITASASASAASLDEGPVYILCGSGGGGEEKEEKEEQKQKQQQQQQQQRVTDGQLVWGSACFVVRGRNFHLRRVQTRRPLSPSTAGAWVVRGQVLYGVIIAVYEDEPFALMMTAERLFSSILGSAFSIRSVELWDGVLPEAYRLHEEERRARMKAAAAAAERAAKKTKDRDRVKVEVRPLNNKKGGGKSGGSLKDNAAGTRLNTVVERVETDQESEAGPSSSRRVGSTTTAAEPREDRNAVIEEPIASPKSYGLPHIEPSAGLGIDEEGVVSTEDSSFVTAIEESATTTTTTTTTAKTQPQPQPPAMRARAQSQASNHTMMSGAVQTPIGEDRTNPLEEEEEQSGAKAADMDMDIEDWHIKDWIPSENNDLDPTASGAEPKEGHFDLKTGPPVRTSVQIAEVSSITTTATAEGRGPPPGPDQLGASASSSSEQQQQPQQQQQQQPHPQQAKSRIGKAWQRKTALDRSTGAVLAESSSSSPSTRGPSTSTPRTSSQVASSSLAAPVLPLPEVTSKRYFFLRRRDNSLKKGGGGGGQGMLDVDTASNASQDSKRVSFLGRFARRNAAEKSRKK